jgi:hypothetical protein
MLTKTHFDALRTALSDLTEQHQRALLGELQASEGRPKVRAEMTRDLIKAYRVGKLDAAGVTEPLLNFLTFTLKQRFGA